ncbi:hypothetical protein MLD38_024017 [Melastoma candidum]|uniref:Uncharacterized protein n=1 Tax=Melastoma candidum TaxID=119954 RepID=A0ACB9NS11_9MYRT|nr:hypothetical protein MLD38_024017 [Melastoma candidum]
MFLDVVVLRSFGRNGQKKLGYGASLCCFLALFGVLFCLRPYLGSLPMLPLTLSPSGRAKFLAAKEVVAPRQQQLMTVKEDLSKRKRPLCFLKDPRSDTCRVNGDIRVQGSSAMVYVVSSMASGNESYRIRPYARKGDSQGMNHVREWNIVPTSDPQVIPKCTFNHRVPGVLFSTGGYSGNNFHAFTDIVVPLFLTSRKYGGEVHFLVTNSFAPWIRKFKSILDGLSRYDIIYIDRGEGVHCFPSVTVGLEHHKELTIDPSRSPYSMKDFRDFLRRTYSLKRDHAVELGANNHKKPRLLIVSRKHSRAFTNVPKIIKLGERVGFEVVVDEATINLTRTAEVVNSCDVMLGVHGAGLTNYLFLPNKAVLIQVVPVGGVEVHAKVCFGDPSKHMNISYLEYSILPRESSLIRDYPEDHLIFREPVAFHRHDWMKFKSIYLDNQDVEIDVNRFKATLVKALQLLNQ